MTAKTWKESKTQERTIKQGEKKQANHLHSFKSYVLIGFIFEQFRFIEN